MTKIALGVAMLGCVTVRARAGTGECIAATESVQRLRKSGHFAEARRAAISCAREDCPHPIAADCKRWLDEIASAQPSIVVRAVVDGADATNVRVLVDGVVVAERLDGRAIAIDPGAHVLRFEHAGFPAVTSRVLIREGERDRITNAVFASLPRPAWHVPVATWVFGALGLAAAGAGIGLWVAGESDRSALYATCGVTRVCTDADKVPAQNELVAGDVAVLAGILALGGAVVIALVSHGHFHASAGPRGAFVGLGGAF